MQVFIINAPKSKYVVQESIDNAVETDIFCTISCSLLFGKSQLDDYLDIVRKGLNDLHQSPIYW